MFYQSVILVCLYYHDQTTWIVAYFRIVLEVRRSKIKIWQRAISSLCPHMMEKEQVNFLASLFIRTNVTVWALPVSPYLTPIL